MTDFKRREHGGLCDVEFGGSGKSGREADVKFKIYLVMLMVCVYIYGELDL